MTSLPFRGSGDVPQQPALWSTMPGWGIVGDLTPPEVLTARQLRVLRRFIAVALLVVLLGCVGAYGYALTRSSDAADEADAATATTTELTVTANKYGGITRIEAATAQVKSQSAAVMASDVDFVKLLGDLRRNLPSSMVLKNVTVNVTPAGSASTNDTGLNTTGRPEIGTISIAGSAKTLDDLPDYVDKLRALPGFVNVIPSSNAASQGVVQFTVNLSVTDDRYSHRFDPSKSGGSR